MPPGSAAPLSGRVSSASGGRLHWGCKQSLIGGSSGRAGPGDAGAIRVSSTPTAHRSLSAPVSSLSSFLFSISKTEHSVFKFLGKIKRKPRNARSVKGVTAGRGL